jgi:predicted nucleotide-binding protein
MTTPTDGEWMSAQEALDFLLSLKIHYGDAVSTLCTRAHTGLIKARAKVFITDEKQQSDVEVPRRFWWARGDAALDQNWKIGDFETWTDHGNTHLEAFGVEFRRQDLEQLRPASTAAKVPFVEQLRPAPPAAPTASTSPAQRLAARTVFIGHGHSQEWRKLAMFLQNDHDLGVIEFNSSSPAGISTTDHLHGMLERADFAFLILTGEDEQATGEVNPRLNVVHEAGLFQGKLGFRKAILFLEEGCHDFSNVRGLTHIPFPKGKIETKFHEATRVLKREMLIS